MTCGYQCQKPQHTRHTEHELLTGLNATASPLDAIVVRTMRIWAWLGVYDDIQASRYLLVTVDEHVASTGDGIVSAATNSSVVQFCFTKFVAGGTLCCPAHSDFYASRSFLGKR